MGIFKSRIAVIYCFTLFLLLSYNFFVCEVYAEDSLIIDDSGNTKELLVSLSQDKPVYTDDSMNVDGILRASPIGIGIVIDRVFFGVNDYFCSMLGYEKEELIGESVRMIYSSQKEYERVGTVLYPSMEKLGQDNIETKFITKTGEILEIYLSLTPNVRNDISKGIIFTAVDITKQKEAEKKLLKNSQIQLILIAVLIILIAFLLKLMYQRKSVYNKLIETKKRMDYILQVTGTKIDVIDEDFNLIYTDPHWENAFGNPKGLKCYEYFGQDIESCTNCGVKDVFKNNEAVTFQRELNCPDKRIFQINLIPFVDRQGRKLAAEFKVDITEMHKTKEELAENEDKFSVLFKNMKEGVAIHKVVDDENGNMVDYTVVDVNPSYEIITKIGYKNIIGKKATEIYDTKEAPYLKEYSQVLQTGAPFYFETFFEPMQKYFSISATYIREGSFATIFEDITERQNYLKEIEAKNEELERFTYTVSHDLKSPIITIKGFAGMLIEDVKQQIYDNLEGDLKRINDATDNMTELLEDLLELSRIGRIINDSVEINMNQLAEDVVFMLSGVIDNRNGEVVIQKDLPGAFGDKRRIFEVFQNLVENSLKFANTSEAIKIKIGYNTQKECYFVEDNGIGIEKEFHESVFGLFNKLDKSKEGTGIGLALVKRIVEIHNGEIWIEDTQTGKGVRFCIKLLQTKG